MTDRIYARIAGTGSYLPEKILTNEDLDRIQHIEEADPHFKARTVRCLYPAFSGGRGLRRALERIKAEVSDVGLRGHESHRNLVADPALPA